jgi:hypothetical protein
MSVRVVEIVGIILIVAGLAYVALGLLGIVPIVLTGTGLTNIRTPAGVAVLGCLLAAFAAKDK